MKKKINHYVAVPVGDSNSSQLKLAKCVRSMIKSEGDESKRAKKIVKMISTEYPDAFHSVLQENGRAPKGDGKMDAEAVLTMLLESNVNYANTNFSFLLVTCIFYVCATHLIP